MDGRGLASADILATAIAFAVLGVLLIVFGLAWSGGRSDSLVDDPKLPDRFDDEERERRAVSLRRGAVGIVGVGVILLIAAACLAIAAR